VQHDQVRRPVLRRRLVALLLVCGLITIVPLAHSSPPDPSWIAGLYDDGDHDDVVLAITSASGLPAMDGTTVSRAPLSNLRAALLQPTRIEAPSRIRPVDRAPPSH
jgi:hypothetical protein